MEYRLKDYAAIREISVREAQRRTRALQIKAMLLAKVAPNKLITDLEGVMLDEVDVNEVFELVKKEFFEEETNVE